MSANADAEARRFIDPAVLARFARPSVWRWLLGVAIEWTMIAGSMWLCWHFRWWWLWPLAIVVIGTRQHALGIMAHEGTHFLVSRNRHLNDFLANALSAYPITYPVQGYRTFHLEHHKWLDTPKDPERASVDLFPEEWRFPMPRARMWRIALLDIVASSRKPVRALIRYIWQVPGGNTGHVVGVILYHAAVLALALYTHTVALYLLLWLVPLFSVALLCFRIRTAAEHSAVAAGERFQRGDVDTMATTRTTIGCPISSKILLGPHNMAYHIEHHLFPNVPVFRLRALHKVLMTHPLYAARAHVTYGYRQLLRQLSAPS
jgi:fatty acid desaturase